MTLQSSFPLKASDINIELGRAGGAPFDIQGAQERALAQVPSGPISFSNFLGKSTRNIVQTDNRTAFSSQAGAVFTFSAVALSTNGFMVILVEHGDQDNPPGLTPTCTIDGVAAARYEPHSTGTGPALGRAAGTVVFIGTAAHSTGDVVVTWNANINVLSLVAVNVLGYSSTPSATFGGSSNNGDLGTVTLNMPANGAAIAIKGDGVRSDNSTWTGITERADTSWNGNSRTWAWDYNISASPSYTISVSPYDPFDGSTSWSGVVLTPS